MTITSKDKLKEELEICTVHEERLKIGLNHLSPMLPLTPEILDNAKDAELAYLDMVANRFGKLQDALGKKIFPLILKVTGEYDEQETFIDKLHRLERLGVIDDTDHWQLLRNIRNILTHEYENDPKLLCEKTNLFLAKCTDLIALWNRIQNYVLDKKLINSN